MAALLALFEKSSDAAPAPQPAPSEPKRLSPPKEAPAPVEAPAPASSSSIGRLMEQFAPQAQESPRHGLPRRQSLGGVNVRDLAAKHEKSEVFTKEAQRQAPKMGRVKPVTMQEISCPTIQEEREASEARSSLENMMDDLLEIDDATLEEMTEQAIRESTSVKESMKESMKQSTNESMRQSTNESMRQSTNESMRQSTNESMKQSTNESMKQSTNESMKQPTKQSTKQSTPPPLPSTMPPTTTTPATTPAEATQPTADSDDSLSLSDLAEELDFDTIVAEMSRNIQESEARDSSARRSSMETTGYTLANLRSHVRRE